MNLKQQLGGISQEQDALISESGVHTFGHLLTDTDKISQRLHGKNVVLFSNDLKLCIEVLIASEGFAKSVTLISPSVSLAVANNLIALTHPDIVVSSSSTSIDRNIVDCAIVENLSEIADQPKIADAGIAETDATAWILSTSGTTGHPKLVQHSIAGLTRSSRLDTVRGAEQVWGLLYDYTRFAGLQVVLQSLLSGACLVNPPTEASLGERLAFLKKHHCTHLSATPTLWRKILMTPESRTLTLQQITLGGEIADESILNGLSRAFPGARISHIFASTEAGVGFSVKDRRPGFPSSFLTEPPSGVRLKIVNGNLWIQNDKVAANYLGDGGTIVKDGWVDTGDVTEIIDDRVYFRGRKSGMINVGGNKVLPEIVEAALLSHPDIAMARVYAKKNPMTGALVAAEIVPVDGAKDTEHLLKVVKASLREKLEKYMVPAILKIVTEFETGTSGKISRD